MAQTSVSASFRKQTARPYQTYFVGKGGPLRSISVGTAIDRAPFFPTARTAKKWLSVDTPFNIVSPAFSTNSYTCHLGSVVSRHNISNPKRSGSSCASHVTTASGFTAPPRRDWVGGAEGNSLRGLQREHGKILSLDGKKVAAYRDAHGKLSLCSPVCTHLKCIVAWNDAEKTWDCPCHGSRFTPTGEVISGPAEEPLEKLRNPGTDSD